MRIYQPLSTIETLERLLADPAVARPRSPHRGAAGAPRQTAPIPAWLDARLVAPSAAGHRRAVHAPGGGARGAPRAARTSWSSRPRPRASRCATTCRSSRRSRRTRPPARSTCSRPRRSARTSWRSFRELAAAAEIDVDAGVYDGDTPGADPARHPRRRPGRGHQPGHAPLRDPAPSHQVVPAVRAAALHRHRRGAHLPRHLRQPRRQRPAPAARGCATTTARSRRSSAARRRSATRGSSPRR